MKKLRNEAELFLNAMAALRIDREKTAITMKYTECRRKSRYEQKQFQKHKKEKDDIYLFISHFLEKCSLLEQRSYQSRDFAERYSAINCQISCAARIDSSSRSSWRFLSLYIILQAIDPCNPQQIADLYFWSLLFNRNRNKFSSVTLIK